MPCINFLQLTIRKHSFSQFRPQTLKDCKTNRKLNQFKLKGHIGWDHRSPRNENFLTFEFSLEYRRVNHIDHQFSYHQTRSIAFGWFRFRSMMTTSQTLVTNCAVVSQACPRSLKIQLDSWWLCLGLLHSQLIQMNPDLLRYHLHMCQVSFICARQFQEY